MISRDTKAIEKKIKSLGIQYHYRGDDNSFVLLCRRSTAHQHITSIREYAFDAMINISVKDIEKRPLLIMVMLNEENG